MFDG
jgi:hypothetical protein